MRLSTQLRAKAELLYEEAADIHKSGWDAATMRRYAKRYAEAHAIDMAHNDARDAEWRTEWRTQPSQGDSNAPKNQNPSA